MRLFKAATVLTDDGHWTIGYEVASACGVLLTAADPCSPTPEVVGNTAPGSAGAYGVVPFGAVARIERPMRCLESDAPLARTRLEGGSEYLAEWVLWNGLDGLPDLASLKDATPVDLPDDTALIDQIRGVIEAQHAAIPGLVGGILHLELAVAMRLTDANFRVLEELGYDVVVSPAYGDGTVAVTGPITVHLGAIEAVSHHDTAENRGVVEATRIMALDFDPCAAFLAA